MCRTIPVRSYGGTSEVRRFLLIGVMFGMMPLARLCAQSAETESKLLVLEHMWNEAQVNRDAKALEGLVSDRFVDTEYDGDVSDKEKFLADIHDPQFKLSVMNIDDVKVRLFHDAAVVTGSYRMKGTYQGKPYDHAGRFTDTWFFENGRWQCVASHSSLVKK